VGKTIILTGGGTAGHVTPNLALIPRLAADGWEIHYLGTDQGIEQKLVASYPFVTFHPVKSGKLRRYKDLRNLTDPFRVIVGVNQSAKLMRQLKPNVVFSKGGFVSVPVTTGAKLAGVPTVLHESDYTPGLANKLSMPFAKVICTTFPETAQALGEKAHYTGTPIRPELFTGDPARGRAFCSFDERLPVLLVMGGSQGARSINIALRANLDALLTRFQIIHLCGKGWLEPGLENRAGYRQFEYISAELPDLLAACDFIVSRSGANSIFEFRALKKPCLHIPLPLSASRGDQILNAKSFQAQGFSRMLLQEGDDLDATAFLQALLDAWAQREQMIAAMAADGFDGGPEPVLEQIYRTAKV
jgi:UDP-N-acetylglucosamine--N-acetylmuramyl-(pentapeptide) pyrophosphoryl-undecaprenol N-acetylglucosamine transferase